VQIPGVAELDSGNPAAVVRENALRKARAVRSGRETTVLGFDTAILGCDTLVALRGRIYGKPSGEAQARDMLAALSGHTHEVFSGLALLRGEQERTGVERTRVRFRELSPGMIDWYLAKGEWRERAGGYAIQGAGAALVRAVEGDYENVVGLPVAILLDLYPELLPASP